MLQKILSTLDVNSLSKYMDMPSRLAYELLTGIASEVSSGIGERLKELITDAEGKRKLQEYAQERDFQRRYHLVELMQAYQRELQAKKNKLQQENIEAKWDLENWNGTLNRHQTKELLINQMDRLLIFLSPPKISLTITNSIHDNLRIDLNSVESFLNEYYNDQNQQKLVKIYTDYFKRSVSSINVDQLQSILSSIPTAIFAIDINDENCYIKVYCWGLKNNQNRLFFSKQWNWDAKKEELISQGYNEKEAVKAIRRIIVASIKFLTAYIADIYYLSFDPWYQIQLPNMVKEFNNHEIDIEDFNCCSDKLQELQKSGKIIYQQELNRLEAKFKKAIKYDLIQPHSYFSSIRSIVITSDSEITATFYKKTIKIWNLKTSKLLHTFTSEYISSYLLTPDGETLVNYNNYDIRFYNTRTGELIYEIEAHSDEIKSIIITSDSETLVSYDYNTIKVWNIKTGKLLHTCNNCSSVTNIWCIMDFNDENIFCANYDMSCGITSIQAWNIKTGQKLHTFKSSTHAISGLSMCVTSDSKILIENLYGNIKIWRIETGQLLHICISNLSLNIISFETSDSQKLVLYSSDSSVIEIWSINTGRLLHTLKYQSKDSIFCDPDRETLIGYSPISKSIQVWNIKTGQLIHNLRDQLLASYYSKHGVNIVSYSYSYNCQDSTIKIWDIKTGELLHICNVHSHTVCSIVITPDGKNLIASSGNKPIKIWNIKTGELLHTFKSDKNNVLNRANSMMISPDGQNLIGWNHDDTIQTWHLPSEICQ